MLHQEISVAPLPPLPPTPPISATHPPIFMASTDPDSGAVVVAATDQPAGPCVVFRDLARRVPTWSDWDEARQRENWAIDNCTGRVRLEWFRGDNGMLTPLITCERDDDADLLTAQFALSSR